MTVSTLKRKTKNALIGFFKLVENRPKRYDGAISTLYHEVGSTPEDYCISTNVFGAQIEYLSSSNARWYTATELAKNISRIDSHNNVCVTFDDGDRSAFQATLDLIEAGGKGTHYVIPGRINQKEKRTMSWEQVRELDELGVEIGSHSMTHPHLTRIGDSELEEELNTSKLTIEDKIGKAVTSFAYPYGEYNKQVIERVANSGYRCAYTTRHLYASRESDIFQIPRFEPLESLNHLVEIFQGKGHRFYQLLNTYYKIRDLSR